MRSGGFRLYVAVQAVALGAFFFTPLESWVHMLWQVGSGLGAVALTLIALRLRPRAGAALWYCLAGGVLLNASGILVDGLRALVFGVQTSPSPADVLWLATYLATSAGIALLIRRRSPGPDRATLVDTAILTTGAALLSWVFLIRPGAVSTSLPLVGRFVVIAYPVADLVIACLLVRLLIGSGSPRPVALLLLVGGLLCLLGQDIGWAAEIQFGARLGPFLQHLLEAGALANYALVGAAALHPSAQHLASRSQVRAPGLGRPLLAGLTTATLIAPGLLAFQCWRGKVTDGPAIAAGSTVLFLLVVTRMVQLVRRVEGQATQLRELALVDELTGLPNRRAWSSELAVAVERARRGGSPLTLAMLDLDHFKRFNDTYGHPAGDQLLRAVAAAWRPRVRAVDQLARYGGEEFILMFPDADAAQADVVIGRLRAVMPLGQTFSAGVAVWNRAESTDVWLDRADRALYTAKQSGRDRTVVADGDDASPLRPSAVHQTPS